MKTSTIVHIGLSLLVGSVSGFSVTNCDDKAEYKNFGSGGNCKCQTFPWAGVTNMEYGSKAKCKLTAYAGRGCTGPAHGFNTPYECFAPGFAVGSVYCC